ncbi:hypothetical protein GP486_008819 [Trichoglossum hirsutum]|uniref:Uncharacterized protein n=1 Tax=Trichoglossum hirsutum TaxID=265104 RepID=A0A9P8HZZ7_9PEZI|nr:hypothetical protein GP486_008819 [Trichoglossum hirsutum]
MTAISQPFQNQDILQRSFVIELDKAASMSDGNSIVYDSHWMTHQLNRYGGREAWQAHHLFVLHKFFERVAQKWNPKYSAKSRLINFEQALLIMAELFGFEHSWLADYLVGKNAEAVVNTDVAFEGLIAWAAQYRRWKSYDPEKKWMVRDIAQWMESQEEYEKNDLLTNPRKLGRYILNHRAYLAEIAGIASAGEHNNAFVYKVLAPKKPRQPVDEGEQ